jgi:hypothetical protein
MKKCGRATEVYSRVTGYFRPVKNWNAGKQEEFRNRLFFEAGKRDGELESPAVRQVEGETCACS